MLIDNADDIVIEKWSYSHGTTWRVHREESLSFLFLRDLGELLTSF